MNGCRVVVVFVSHSVSTGKNVGQFIKHYNYLQTVSLVNSSLPSAPFKVLLLVLCLKEKRGLMHKCQFWSTQLSLPLSTFPSWVLWLPSLFGIASLL